MGQSSQSWTQCRINATASQSVLPVFQLFRKFQVVGTLEGNYILLRVYFCDMLLLQIRKQQGGTTGDIRQYEQG